MSADDARARWLMADLVQWHRREEKPDWWRYFERALRYESADFVADSDCIGGLELVGEVGLIKRSIVWRYRFDASQEFKFGVDDEPLNPAIVRRRVDGEKVSADAGTIVGIDEVEGFVDLKRGIASKVPHPADLMPSQPIGTGVQRQSLRRTAEHLLQHGVDGGGPAEAARRLLARRAPRVRGMVEGERLRRDDESVLDATCRVVADLDRSWLAVQGPPGSGKTYTAGRAILAALPNGRVGVTAFAHAAICKLLESVIEAAEKAGRTVRILQKVSEVAQALDHPWITMSDDAADVASRVEEFDVVAGTSFQFAREDMVEAVHTLVIDEAGQLSLANVLAVAPAGANLVLVGDPQQLSQPSKGTHPDGAGVSALEHVLEGGPTIPDHLGIFLDVSWRMHPAVCEFISEQVYAGRLQSQPECASQEILAEGLVRGHGLRWVPIDHVGNRTSSPEEAEAVRRVFGSFVGQKWIDSKGVEHALGLDDVLVVAPYNAQVNEIRRTLPAGARVGTVDKFQGQEAPIVIVSLAASSADDIPRGMEFLYSRNRINVAVSRAQALAVVVGSPTLLSVRCNSIDQLRLANVLCRYVEMAEEVQFDGNSAAA